jgi:hypothetical protein
MHVLILFQLHASYSILVYWLSVNSFLSSFPLSQSKLCGLKVYVLLNPCVEM